MIAILKYNAGNTRSVENALNRLGVNPVITDDPSKLRSAEKVIFPGVGEANSAMHFLITNGLDKVLQELQQPILGICLGLQLMCNSSEEGGAKGLGFFDLDVKKFRGPGIIPHMGWNNLNHSNSKLLTGLPAKADFYFVHSFFAPIGQVTMAQCDYIQNFSAVLESENHYATQFHPEKSGQAGEKVLKNFLDL